MNLILETLDKKSKYLLQYAVALTFNDKQYLEKSLKEAISNRWLEMFTMKCFDKENIKSDSHEFIKLHEQINQCDNSETQLMYEIYMFLMVLIDIRKIYVLNSLMKTYTTNTDEALQLYRTLVTIGLNYKHINTSFQHAKFESVIEYSENTVWSKDSKSFMLDIIENIESYEFKHSVEEIWNQLHPNDTFTITTGENFYLKLKNTDMKNKTVMSKKNEEVEVLTDVWHNGEDYCVTNSTKIKNICELAHKQGIEFKISPVSYISTSVFACGMYFWTAVFLLSVIWILKFCIKSSGDYWFIPVIYTLAFAFWNKGNKLFKFWYKCCVTGIITIMKSFIFISNKPFITATALIAGILTYMNLEKLNSTVTQIINSIMTID